MTTAKAGGFSPLDEQLALPELHWSAGVVRRVVWLSGKFSYGDATAVLDEESEVSISKSTVWQLTQRWGERIGEVSVAEEAEIKAHAREWSTPGGELPEGKMGVAIDGAMLNISGEGWKEFKVACVFEVEDEMRRNAETGDYAEFGHAVKLSYVGSLGSAAQFGWPVWTEAHRRGWQQAREQQVLGDGALWIWNLRDEHFPESETLVDWYHATEHLGTAKTYLYPEATAAASRWYNALELTLFQGHADRVARELSLAAQRPELSAETAAALRKAAQYFKNNQRCQFTPDNVPVIYG